MMQFTVLFSVCVVAVISESSLDFLVIGDWGGLPFPPWVTPQQKATAAGMEKIGAQLKPNSVISLGDNFYNDGIPTDEDSNRFENTWNVVYNGESLQVPWYLIGGNHDHYGNITAQIAFSEHDSRWTFPNIYYTKSFTSKDDPAFQEGDTEVTMDIIFIDTIDLAGSSNIEDETDEHYYDKLPAREVSDAPEQWNWIEEQLKASKADYLVVVGHYPVYSVCEHGNTDNLVTNLKPLLVQYGAHYLAGHDHCMSSAMDENELLYIVSGIGHGCCSQGKHVDEVPSEYLKWYLSLETRIKESRTSSGGFSSMTATATGMSVTFYDQDGAVLYTTAAVRPRAQA